ncbi:MAG: DsbC family protein [Pseudomonadota bacterium]
MSYRPLIAIALVPALGLVLTLTAALAHAAEPADDTVRDAVKALMPGAQSIEVFETPVPGLSEVLIGAQVVYVTADGGHMLAGPLVDANSGENLTENRVAFARKRLLAADEAPETFRWPADNERHAITVVTDIDCPYCRRLHKTLPEYHAAGISVEYVMLPRSGRDTPSWHKTVGAACAEDPETAITEAMNGAKPSGGACEHPIGEHVALARSLGVASTPTIILPDGQMMLGQQPAAKVLERIEAGR